MHRAISYGLVEENILYSDSTHLKANANKNTFINVEVTQKNYLDELDKAVEKNRIEHGKNPFKSKGDDMIHRQKT